MSRSSLLLAVLPLLHVISSTFGQTSTAIGATQLSGTQQIQTDRTTSSSSSRQPLSSSSSSLSSSTQDEYSVLSGPSTSPTYDTRTQVLDRQTNHSSLTLPLPTPFRGTTQPFYSSTPNTSSTMSQPSPSATHQCTLVTNTLCPACNGGFRVSEYGFYDVECDTAFANVDYYEVRNANTVGTCLDASYSFSCGIGGIVWGTNGTCFIPCGDRPQQIYEAGWAFVASRFTGGVPGPVPAYSSANVTTKVRSEIAHWTTVPLGMPRQCGLLDLTCPQCDGAHVFDGHGRRYNISCDTYFMSPSGSAATSKSIFTCMNTCDNHPRCVNAVWGPDKSCELNYEETRRVRRKGYVGLQPVSNVTMTRLHSSAASNAVSTTSPKKCHANAIACPACNKKEIKGTNGTTYRVLCANKLFSETNSAVQQFVSPEGCVAECEHFKGCKGATWWPDGNCNLARGEDVFPQQAAGHIAFQSIDPNYSAPPPELSAFPTGTFKPLTVASSTTASSRCNPYQIHCPECDGLSLADGFNETYRVQCNFEPICDDIAGRFGYTAQNDCMEHCDMDPTCLAAIYNAGRCDLCQGSLEGFMTYSSPDEYVVFVAEPFLDPVKPSVTAGRPPNWTGRSMRNFSTSRSQTRSSRRTSHPEARTSTRTVAPESDSTSRRSSRRITRTTLDATVQISTSWCERSSHAITRTTTHTVESASTK